MGISLVSIVKHSLTEQPFTEEIPFLVFIMAVLGLVSLVKEAIVGDPLKETCRLDTTNGSLMRWSSRLNRLTPRNESRRDRFLGVQIDTIIRNRSTSRTLLQRYNLWLLGWGQIFVKEIFTVQVLNQKLCLEGVLFLFLSGTVSLFMRCAWWKWGRDQCWTEG